MPLSNALLLRRASRELRDLVDEVWWTWGIRASTEGELEQMKGLSGSGRREDEINFCGPLAVYAKGGSHAHHLASVGALGPALMLAKEEDINDMIWDDQDPDQSPLVLALRARQRLVGSGAGGRVLWRYVLGDEEATDLVRVALACRDVNSRPPRAWPLMSYCAERGCVEAVKLCLDKGAKVEEAGGYYREWWTALVHAAYGGHEAVVEALLVAGASAKVGLGGRDQTLATVCEGHPTLHILRRLVEAGADVNAPGAVNSAALRCAASRGNMALMEALVEVGASVAGIGSDGLSAMHEAASGEVVRRLAARGACVQGDGVNDSPLQWACLSSRVDAISALVELGADVRYRGWQRSTPLHRAVGGTGTEEEVVAIVQVLLRAGADARAADEDGETPLHCIEHAACMDALQGEGQTWRRGTAGA